MSATEGKRLLAFMHKRAPRATGGLDGLATRHGLRRQTPYEWAAGTRKPNLETLRAWAAALEVTRTDMVAAMDGVTAPEQQETPPPEWAGAMESRIVSEVQANREALYARLAEDAALKALRLAGLLPDEPTDEKPDQPPGSVEPSQGPTV